MSLSSELSEEAASAPIGDNVNGEDNKSTVIPAESTDSPNNDWLLARLARALLAVILYVVFTYSVQLQSVYTKRPVEPARWKTELKGGGWLAGFLLFSCLFAASCASISLEPQGPASKAVNGIFIIVLFLIHVLTAVYASQRPELCSVSRSLWGPLGCPSGQPIGFRPFFWRNWLSIAAIVLEFVQLMTLTLDSHVNPTARSYLHLTLFQVSSGNTVFYLCCAIVSVYVLLVGLFVEYDVQPSHKFAPVLYDFAGGILYLPLASRLLVLLVQATDRNVVCACMVMLLMYSTTAVFVGTYNRDQAEYSSDIIFAPRHLVLERTVKSFIAAVYVLKQRNTREYNYVLLTSLVFYAGLLLLTKCCSSPFVARVRGLLVLVSCLSTVVAVITQAVPSLSYTMLFLSGLGGLAVLVTLIPSLHSWHVKRSKTLTARLQGRSPRRSRTMSSLALQPRRSSSAFNNPLFLRDTVDVTPPVFTPSPMWTAGTINNQPPSQSTSSVRDWHV